MDEIVKLLSQIPLLDAALIPVAILLAYILRQFTASVVWFDVAHTALAALAFGIVGAVLILTQHETSWQLVGVQGIACGTAVLVAERAMKALADKGVPGFPADNSKLKVPPVATPPETPGGTP